VEAVSTPVVASSQKATRIGIMKRKFLGSVLTLALLLLSATTVHAGYVFDVFVNTSSMRSDINLGSPFGIAFDMISGGVASSNTATISNFDFDHEGPFGSPFTQGNASGDLSSMVKLGVDPVNHAFSYFDQGFTPGGFLTFQVDLSNNPASTPDTLSFFLVQNYTPGGLLSGASSAIPTNSPNGINSFFDVFTSISPGSAPTSNTYSSLDGEIPQPTITPLTPSVPEPSSLALFGIGAVCSLGYSWRRRRQSACLLPRRHRPLLPRRHRLASGIRAGKE
jgi:hypothetical protein